MGDDKKPTDPQEILNSVRNGIKSSVDGVNNVLHALQESAENVKKPVVSATQSIQDESSKLSKQVIHTYNKRQQYAKEIIGGSALVGASWMWLRRGKFAGLVGGAAMGGLAYGVVYDQFDLEGLPDAIFGKK